MSATELEIKNIVRFCLERGRQSMWHDLTIIGAICDGNGWDDDVLDKMTPVSSEEVDAIYELVIRKE